MGKRNKYHKKNKKHVIKCECGFVSKEAINTCPDCGANLKEKKHSHNSGNGHPVPRKAVIFRVK